MSEIKKQVRKLPPRLSAPSPEQSKPSKWIAVFWWAVFIIPVIFTYIATKSFIPPAILIGIRIAVMYVPNPWASKKTSTVQPVAEPVTEPDKKVNAQSSTLSPYIEEAREEVKGLMKFLRIYNHDKEDKYLNDYRKLRGWE